MRKRKKIRITIGSKSYNKTSPKKFKLSFILIKATFFFIDSDTRNNNTPIKNGGANFIIFINKNINQK